MWSVHGRRSGKSWRREALPAGTRHHPVRGTGLHSGAGDRSGGADPVRTFAPRLRCVHRFDHHPAAIAALQLSLLVVAIVVPLNVIFGVPTALVLARNRFRGKSLLQAVVDLPFAVSPVVVGVALILLWGSAGALGAVEHTLGFKIIFGLPGIVLASIFVTVPFVIREVEPVLHELGTDQEGRRPLSDRVVADVLADHAALDPMGADLRHRAHGGAHAG